MIAPERIGGSLIARMFHSGVEGAGDGDGAAGSAAEYLARQIDSEAMASILTRHALNRCGGSKRKAKAQVRDWVIEAFKVGAETAGQPGRLSDNVARLAWLLALLGKSVVIVTTNYDSYIREALDRARESSSGHLGPVSMSVSFDFLSPGSKIDPAVLCGGSVKLLYLHGHIDSDERAPQPLSARSLVLSEGDYARRRKRSRNRLMELLRIPATGFPVGGGGQFDGQAAG